MQGDYIRGQYSRIPIAELSNVDKGVPYIVNLLSAQRTDGGEHYFWKSPFQNTGVENINVARLVILGPHDAEQYVGFLLINENGLRIVSQDQINIISSFSGGGPLTR